MLFWLFIAFHVGSWVVCYLATRSTFRYLSKHQVVPKSRYMLFGWVRFRYVSLTYVLSITVLSLGSIIYGTYFHLFL